jgi:ribosome-binding protein aMBF1 (putative translation factor)
MPNQTLTRHCHQCGWEWPLPAPPGRTESCHQCGADMKVCLNCASYNLRSAHQCRDRRADPVADKHLANFCEYFEFTRRTWTPKNQPDARAESARDQLRKLLGD